MGTYRPLVSVVMITRNHEKYIEEAVNGVLMQRCDFDYELIIAEDHSSDNTAEIVNKILKENSRGDRIRFVSRERNMGMVDNFMDCVDKSVGKYIAICEGDDYWTDPRKLEKQVGFLEKNSEFSMVCHDAIVSNEMDHTLKTFFSKYHGKQICYTKDTLNIHFCPAASICFKKEFLAVVKYHNLDIKGQPMAADQLLVQLLSLQGPIFRMKDVMSVYRIHEAGASQVAKKYMIEGLKNRINSLVFLNRFSNFRFRRNIRIEILLIRNRINLMKSRSQMETKVLQLYRKMLALGKRIFY